MDDLISRKAALEALGEMPENWTDSPEEIEAVNSWCFAVDVINSAPFVPSVPLYKLCDWLSENSINIPCESCPNFSNDYCTAAVGDASKPCPRTANDWWQAITKWMEEQHD